MHIHSDLLSQPKQIDMMHIHCPVCAGKETTGLIIDRPERVAHEQKPDKGQKEKEKERHREKEKRRNIS